MLYDHLLTEGFISLNALHYLSVESEVITAIASSNDLESVVYAIIKRETEAHGGVLQRKLKEFPELKGVKPRELQHIVKSLIEKNLIKRVKVPDGEKMSYLLQAITIEEKPKTERSVTTAPTLTTTLNNLLDIPCVTCKYLNLCGSSNIYTPTKCTILTKYLLSQVQKLEAKS
ncbi:MAG: hypothetical protein JHC33_06045 [Ignisphaera sp.]|nr:hypothetical protein [Ignisphaera sp.]